MLTNKALAIAIRNRNQDQAYLINDTFTTDRAAGAVNGTAAEPGPGRRTVIDGNSKMSLSGGALALATGGVSNGDPGIWYNVMARTPGRMVIGQCTTGSGRYEIGYDGNQFDAPYDCIRFNGTNLEIRDAAIVIVVGSIVTATSYQVAVINRRPGAMWLIKGGSFSNWTLLFATKTPQLTDFELFATIQGFTNSVATFGYIRVPAALWLPSPLISDGFSAWGSSDGLGHAEGIAGGLGSGGGSLAYTTVGTWGAAAGVASASALSGGFAIAYRALATADIIATVKVTRSGGDAGLLLRYTDGNNHITCHHNGTNVVLLKKVAGSSTTVQSTAATYVAGAELRVVAEGSAFRVYYNNALVGSAQTISDAALQSPTNVGLYTTNTGNLFDDLVVHARGTGGEYAVLDAY